MAVRGKWGTSTTATTANLSTARTSSSVRPLARRCNGACNAGQAVLASQGAQVAAERDERKGANAGKHDGVASLSPLPVEAQEEADEECNERPAERLLDARHQGRRPARGRVSAIGAIAELDPA
jgi:hypothetical protein